MNVFAEFAPLLAAAAPVLMIAVINVCLALQGERDTLLLPALGPYPAAAPAGLAGMPRTETANVTCFEPANDEMARKAA